MTQNLTTKHRDSDGFTLVELMVVLAIVATMSVASVVGYGALSDSLKSRQVTGFIQDTVSHEALKVLRGDFRKAVIHFKENYLIIEEWEETSAPILSLGGACGDNYNLSYSANGNLTKTNGEGEVLDILAVQNGLQDCENFTVSPDAEWQFQLAENGSVSAVIRFLHFNLNREDISNPFRVDDAVAGSRLEIRAPYAKKSLHNALDEVVETLELTVSDADGNATDSFIIR